MTIRSVSVMSALVLVVASDSHADTAATHETHTNDPCVLLTTADVERAFPGTKPGRTDRSQEKYGLVSCHWDYPGGTLSIIGGTEAEDSVKEEAKGLTLIFLDPLRADAGRNVRYEALSGVGDEAIAIVEREDKSKGFMQNGAVLVVRRGKRQVAAVSTDLARRDRAEALKVLAELGKAIAKRLE